MKKASILVVEDQYIIAADIEDKLKLLGYRFAGSTASGIEAVELASRVRPDLVLMDVRLNGTMDGIEAAMLIRRELGIPVVFLTAHSDAETVRRASHADAFGYLLKPFEERDLLTHIELALYKHATEQRLVEADRRKSEFIGLLSHELRNPLEAIRGGLEMLDMDVPPTDHAQKCMAILRRQTSQLTRLVDDLLDVTRITQNKLQLRLQTLDLNELVAKVLDDDRLLRQRGLELTRELGRVPVYVKGDAGRLSQVLVNLLHNAAKFTPTGGKVTVALAVEAGRAVLRVADTGYGIDAGLLDGLFEPFVQADRTLAHGAGGLGLGLSMVKGIVELHEGEVSAASRGPSHGAEFIIQLPLDSGRPAHEVAAPLPVRRRRRLLIVDDNPDIADVLREVLQHEGHDVDVAYSGAEALDKVRASPPELVLCDIGLPGMNGYELVTLIRTDPALRSIFLVAISGYAQPSDVARALSAGFDEHLAKPLNTDRIAQILADADQSNYTRPAANLPR